MTKSLALILTGTAALSLQACSNAATTAASTGSTRLNWTSQAVHFDTTGGVGVSTLSSPGSVSSSAVSVPLSLTQIATLVPPVINSSSLQANAVVFSGSKAYVAYNTQGSGVAGGIDVIDFTVPSAPVMTSTFSTATTEYNALVPFGTHLYAVGANDSDHPAVLSDFNLVGGDISGAPTNVTLPGYTGVSVKADLLNVYALSGDNGGLSVIARTGLTSNSYTAIPDARDLSADLLGVNVVTGRTASTHAQIRRYSLLGLLDSTSADMTGATQADGAKATIVSGTLLHLATAGTGGTNLVCGLSGSIATNIPIPASATLTPDLRASNSAVFGNGLIYVANGAMGISVYTMELGLLTPSCTVTSSYVGRIMFEDGVSANNVSYSGGKLIVATGLGGFRIINVTQGLSIGLQLTL